MNHHYLDASQFLELSSDIAENMLQSIWPECPYITEPNGGQRLTDEAQNLFNGLIDVAEAMLRRGGVHPDT